MKSIRALHVASFHGNIGDNANHVGFREQFRNNTDFDVEYTEFEIRETFWGSKHFDTEFVEFANTFDLLIIGGGNYFELWVEKSRTGCSIDIALEDLRNIRVPTLFNALGVDPGQGASEACLNKFRAFLDVAIEKPNMLLSCRNDGAMQTLRDIVGPKYANVFYHVPDPGFFTQVPELFHPELQQGKQNVLVQLAGDMLDQRFPNQVENDISYEMFLKELTRLVTKLVERDAHVILVPHIFRDISVIAQLLNVLPDKLRRNNVSVAPYLLGASGQDYIFSLYKSVDLVLGMRFHANVCSMALGTPVVGLVNYLQIERLYQEMSMTDYMVHVNKADCHMRLWELCDGILRGGIEYPSDFLAPWQRKLQELHGDVKALLS
jgi:polysaccharide pyruvyl transferase WcaK-like protein